MAEYKFCETHGYVLYSHGGCDVCGGPVLAGKPFTAPKVREGCRHPGEPLIMTLAGCDARVAKVCKHCGLEI